MSFILVLVCCRWLWTETEKPALLRNTPWTWTTPQPQGTRPYAPSPQPTRLPGVTMRSEQSIYRVTFLAVLLHQHEAAQFFSNVLMTCWIESLFWCLLCSTSFNIKITKYFKTKILCSASVILWFCNLSNFLLMLV